MARLAAMAGLVFVRSATGSSCMRTDRCHARWCCPRPQVLDHLRTSMAELESQAVRFTIEGALVRRGLCVMDGVFAVDESARLGAAAAHGAFEEQTERNFLRACIWHAK